MAFTRKFLSALGIEPEKIDEIMSAHVEVTDALKAQIADSKADTVKLAEVQAELDKTKEELKTANKTIEAANKENYKQKYEDANNELEKLKTENSKKETTSKKKAALSKLLKNDTKMWDDAFSPDGIEYITEKGGISDLIEFDDKGNISNADAVKAAIEADKWCAKHIPHKSQNNLKLEKPPINDSGEKKWTKKEIEDIPDTSQRQQLMAEHSELFGVNVL